MANISFGSRRYPRPAQTTWRHRLSVFTVLSTVALIGWGGFVTSIDAGMAVPDWPASFGSFDPFRTGFHDPSDPTAQWWHSVPILAEHGHRLLGMLVGLLTAILAAWTWMNDPRRWMRWLGIGALVLVSVQGVLGGLRVVYISLDLAVIHACVAQLFFALITCMALFTSKRWMQPDIPRQKRHQQGKLRLLSGITIAALYIQIILGALLRHPGASIDQTLATLHIAWAFVCMGVIALLVIWIRKHFKQDTLVRQTSTSVASILVLQVLLGFTAYFVILDEAGVLQPSNFQVLVNTSHLVIGSLLFASAAMVGVLAMRGYTRNNKYAATTRSSSLKATSP